MTAPVAGRQPRIPYGRQPHHRRFAGRQPSDRGEPERSHLRQLRYPEPAVHALRALQEQGRLKSDGTVAEITLADGTVYQTKGVITFIDKQVNTNTSVVAARAEFVNPDLFVLPGQFVRVTLSGMELVNAILIPQQAVIQTQKGSMVVVIGEGDKAEMRGGPWRQLRRQFPAEQGREGW